MSRRDHRHHLRRMSHPLRSPCRSGWEGCPSRQQALLPGCRVTGESLHLWLSGLLQGSSELVSCFGNKVGRNKQINTNVVTTISCDNFNQSQKKGGKGFLSLKRHHYSLPMTPWRTSSLETERLMRPAGSESLSWGALCESRAFRGLYD